MDNTIRNNNDQMIMVNDKDYEDNVDNLTIPIVGFVESQQKGFSNFSFNVIVSLSDKHYRLNFLKFPEVANNDGS